MITPLSTHACLKRITLITKIFLEKEEVNLMSKQRIIFVGVHNKQGMSPLDPKSKSGKLISKCIEYLGTDQFTFERSNLWDMETMPAGDQLTYTVCFDWANRVNWHTSDIIITLGDMVQKPFTKVKKVFPFIKMGHPSAVWSHSDQDLYILRMEERIQEFLKKNQ